MTECKHADSGCNYPEGDCLGVSMDTQNTPGLEVLRSGFTPDGQRVFLLFDQKRVTYRIATRWVWLGEFACLADAMDVFEVVEFAEGDLRQFARAAKKEARRVPVSRMASRSPISRTWFLLDCAQKRVSGLRPTYCGAKGSVIHWRAATAKATSQENTQ